MSFFRDLSSDLHFQSISDAFRNSVHTAAHIAASIPEVAANITGIVQKYPHLTPGVTLALGQAGYGPNDSITDSAAQLAAQRKVDSGMGWHSIGDTVNPTHPGTGMLAVAGIHFPEIVGNTLKDAISLANRGLDDIGSATETAAKATARTVGVLGQSGAQFTGALVRGGVATSPEQAKSQIMETTAGQAVSSLFAGNGLGIGRGWAAKGPAVNAANAQQQADSLQAGTTLTYADHPFFSLKGESAPSPHLGTPGRLALNHPNVPVLSNIPILKDIITPGTDLYSAGSGILDAAVSFITDPVSKLLGAAGEAHAGSSAFTPEDLGASHPQSAVPTIKSATAPFTAADETLSPTYVPPTPIVTPASIHPQDIGLIDGTRQSLDTTRFVPWLDLDKKGIDTVNGYAANNSAYDIFMRSGGMKGSITPELSGQLASESTPDGIRNILKDQLGVGLMSKPGLDLQSAIGVRDRLDSIRMFQNLPDISATNLSDSKAVAQQLILNSRNFKAPQTLIEKNFDGIAAATSDHERWLALQHWELDMAHHAATTDLSGITGTEKQFNRLRAAFGTDADVHAQILRDEIAMKTPTTGIQLNGEQVPFAHPYLDQDLYSVANTPRFYEFPDVRTVKQVTSTYGRLLTQAGLDVPHDLLVHIQDQWRKVLITKPATAVRVIAEGSANMAARGLGGLFSRDALDVITKAIGRTPTLEDHLDNPISFANDNNKFYNKMGELADNPTNFQSDIKARSSEVKTPDSPDFSHAIANNIQNLHTDDVSRMLASGHANPIDTTLSWLLSDDPAAIAYRDQFDITADNAKPYIVNRANVLQAQTANHPSLLSAVANGEYPSGNQSFSTAKGSTYEVHDDGTTTRNKAARPEHPGDSGPQPRSQKTVYVTEENANRLATPQGEWRFVEKDGQLTLASRTSKERPWGVAPSQRNIQFESTPRKGLLPIELWNQKEGGFTRVHFGNAITEVTGGSQSISNIDAQGNFTFQPGFQNHLRGLVNNGILAQPTIGGIATLRSSDAFNGAAGKTVDWLFNHLFKIPVETLIQNPAYEQLYLKNLAKTIPNMAEDVQQAAIASAEKGGLSKAGVQALKDIAAKRSGILQSQEAIDLTKAFAQQDMKRQFYDLYNRKQIFDATRLITPFANSWAQSLKVAANLLVDRPQVIPRAVMMVNGAVNSGFFFKDPQTGQESMALPGGAWMAKKITGGLPFQPATPLSSVASFGSSALMPGVGPILQFAANKVIPDKPQYQSLRNLISPRGAPVGLRDFIPSWANNFFGSIGSPKDTKTWGNTVMAAMQYNASTGKYDLSDDLGKQKLIDDSLHMAKRLYLFKSLAGFTLPGTPNVEDVVKDINGQDTLTFAMTQKYQQWFHEDIHNHTDLAMSNFVDNFGMKNILGMQSASQAINPAPTNQAGYDWMRNNGDIARTYPNVYSLFAPNDGGFSQQAYRATFANGERKMLTPAEALDAANSRVATMIYRNAKDALPTHPNAAQTDWLKGVKDRLLTQYNGWNPDFVGTRIPGEIRELQKAVADPRLAKAPATEAIQAYLQARDAAIAASGLKNNGWQQSPNAVATREYLRQYAAFLVSKVPEFQQAYDGLLSHEMKDDVTVSK